mgnify:CR=1 FL=1
MKKSPVKKINFSKLKDKIQSSKFGQSKLGQTLTKVTGAIGGIAVCFGGTKGVKGATDCA